MRVIGGIHRGRRLRSPRGDDIRPTSDRVREAIFDFLGPFGGEERVADLFAGTGALGIEALSRNAAFAAFVDKSPRASLLIRENLDSLGLSSRAEVFTRTAARGVALLARRGERFDLVLLDPPYAGDWGRRTLELPGFAGLLAPGAVVVVEHGRDSPPGHDVGGLGLLDARVYGDTWVSYYRREGRQ